MPKKSNGLSRDFLKEAGVKPERVKWLGELLEKQRRKKMSDDLLTKKGGSMGKTSRIGKDPLAWIGEQQGSKQGLQKKQLKQSKPSVREGLRDGYTRATFIIKDTHLEKLKARAYWDRRQIKQVLGEALDEYFKGKRIKPLPKA